MDALHTRRATAADLDAVAPLFDAYRQFYAQPADLALARRFLQERLEQRQSVILLGLDGAQRIVGFCQLYPTFCSVEAKPIYTLYDLFVIPGARRTGTGRTLLQAAERQAVEDGKARMDLSTARTNLAAQSLYESLGWIRDEQFHVYSRRLGSAE